MKKFALHFVAVALVAAVLLPALSHAQAVPPFDHLKCYQIKDPQAKAQYKADLIPLQSPPFSVEPGCIINVPAKLFCIPVQKTNVQPTPPLAVSGVNAQDYLLYKIKCPISVVIKGGMPLAVADQFGQRTILVGKHKLLLVPAYKVNQPTPTRTPIQPTPTPTRTPDGGCSFIAPKMCAGDCPNPGEICVQVLGTTNCRCEPPNPCSIDAAGQCGGDCSTIAPGLVCLYNTNNNQCRCEPATNGCKPDLGGACIGFCPGVPGAANSQCVGAAAGCGCL